LNQQATTWRDEFANNREHDETGKIPALVFKHEEQHLLRPLSDCLPFETDDIESAGVTKLFRVRFDRNRYSVPPRLVGQTVVVRANDEVVAIYLGPKQVALASVKQGPNTSASSLQESARFKGKLRGLSSCASCFPNAKQLTQWLKSWPHHVGAEYVEYVLRHKRGLVPAPPPLRLGDPELDTLNFAEPDLSVYDQIHLPQKTLDPREPPDTYENR